MMNKLTLAKTLFLSSFLTLGFPGYLAASNTAHVYPSGMKVALQIGSDLYDSLDAKYRSKLEAQPVCPSPASSPELVLVQTNDENRLLCKLSISAGFVDLMNHIAHAKAIDKKQPGFFIDYMQHLSVEIATGPELKDESYWTTEVMNDQASYFNQMMGLTMAINFSHHYLGQINNHSSQIPSDKIVPINSFLTSQEWDSGVRAGAVNALNCAFGTEGAKSLFDAIGKMQQRPGWTLYIVPQTTDINKLNKQLAKYEVDFFHGGLN